MLRFWAVSSWSCSEDSGVLVTFPVPSVSFQLETFAFRFGWEFGSRPVKFPWFWLYATEWSFLREGTQRAELDCLSPGWEGQRLPLKETNPRLFCVDLKLCLTETQVLKT